VASLKEGPIVVHDRTVNFVLRKQELLFSHFGIPFTQNDVEFICGISESTESHGLTDIGHFGIGFKSVYSFTDAPEIHSGAEHFAIDSFVWPREIPTLGPEKDQTVFRFPFRPDDNLAHADIHRGLSELGFSTLLFLREIDQIEWSTEDGVAGTYLRDTKSISHNLRKVTLIGQKHGENYVRQDMFLVFDRPVQNEGKPAGSVEIALRIEEDRISRVENAALSVFFPTIVPRGSGLSKTARSAIWAPMQGRGQVPLKCPVLSILGILESPKMRALTGACILTFVMTRAFFQPLAPVHDQDPVRSRPLPGACHSSQCQNSSCFDSWCTSGAGAAAGRPCS
jgi:hypothetical protein